VFRAPGAAFGPPQALSSQPGAPPVLAVNDIGAAAAAWYVDTTGDPSGNDPGRIALRSPGGAFDEGRTIHGLVPQIGIDRDGNGYAITEERTGNDFDLSVVTVPADGGPLVTRPVAHVPGGPVGTSLAVDPSGTATVAWSAIVPGDSFRNRYVYVATAAPGTSFGEPVVVSSAYYDNNQSGQAVRVVTDASGDVLVMWPLLDRVSEPQMISNDHTIRGAFRPAGGSFGHEEQVPTPTDAARGVYRWDAAMGPNGDALVAWSGIGSDVMAYRPRGGGFEPAHIPEPYPVCCAPQNPTPGEMAVAFDGLGNGAVAFVSAGRVQVVRHALGAGFLAPQSAGEGAHLFSPDLAFDGAGRGIVMWSPQEPNSSEASNNEHGIFAADYDPDAPPRLAQVLVQKKLGRFGLEATDQGTATLSVRRKTLGPGGTVVFRRRKVVPGYNAVQLTKRENRQLGGHRRYVAKATFKDLAGHPARTVLVRFGSF
jgi:hypothetical protein